MGNDSTIAPSVFNREFDAPRDLVFDCWTQVEHLKNWQFPMQGFTCDYVKADIKPGGSSLHKMTSPDGHEMWLLTEYHEISKPSQLVFTQYNSNAHGDKVPSPQMPNWPGEIRATLNFSESEGKTQLEFIWQPINPTAEEAAVFEASRDQHGNGWGAGFNQLERYLSEL